MPLTTARGTDLQNCKRTALVLVSYPPTSTSYSNLDNILRRRSSTVMDGCVKRMDELSSTRAMNEQRFKQDRQISEIVAQERSRLRNFIRRRVADPRDAEDILQEVFYE